MTYKYFPLRCPLHAIRCTLPALRFTLYALRFEKNSLRPCSVQEGSVKLLLYTMLTLKLISLSTTPFHNIYLQKSSNCSMLLITYLNERASFVLKISALRPSSPGEDGRLSLQGGSYQGQ